MSDLYEVRALARGARAATDAERAIDQRRQELATLSGPEEDMGGIGANLQYILLGDIYEIIHEDANIPLWGLAIRTVVSMIPYVDQVADVEDMGAWIYIASTRGIEDDMVKLQGLLCFIGVVPVIGSAARGVLKCVAKNPRSLEVVLRVVNRIGDGHGVRWLRQFTADLPSHAADAARHAAKVIDGLIATLRKYRGYRIMPNRAVRKMDEWIAGLEALGPKIPGAFDDPARMLKRKLDDLLADFDRRVFDTDSAARSQAVRRQAADLPPDGNGVVDDVWRRSTPDADAAARSARRLDELNVDDATRKTMADHGLTPETRLYRVSDPQYVDVDRMEALANPHSCAQVADPYNRVANPYAEAIRREGGTVPDWLPTDLPSTRNAGELGPSLNVAVRDPGMYASEGMVRYSMSLDDVLAQGGKIYPDTGALAQGIDPLIVTLPNGRVPIRIEPSAGGALRAGDGFPPFRTPSINQ